MASRDGSDAVGTTRRALLLGAGAVGAVGVLAACASAADPPATSGPGAATDPATPATSAPAGPVLTVKVSEIPVGAGTIYPDQHVVVTQPTAGTFKAFSSTCTHMGCTVGTIEAGKIICPCHGSAYNIADGSVANGPTNRPLPARTATVEGDTITISA